MQLRYYQLEAVQRAYDYLRAHSGNPCVVLPTGAGKTPVIAQLCRDAVIQWDGRVLVLSHVKELIEQSANKIQLLCPTIKVGIYSAGLNSRDTQNAVICAGIQSVYNRAAELGRFDLILVDEAHLIPASGQGMYRELIAGLQEINPDVRVIGLTATPFRLDSGPICTDDGILNHICYEVGIRPLIAQGFLSKIVGKSALAHVETRGLKIVRGEFEQEKLEAEYDRIIESAIAEIVEKTVNRKSVLIFCQNVGHGRRVTEALRQAQRNIMSTASKELEAARSLFDLTVDPVPTIENHVAADWLEENDHPVDHLRFCLTNLYRVGEVYGDTKNRDELISGFKSGELKYLVNVNVLTTGFDAPNVDCVVLLRSTVSAGLFYQMVGRGFRVCEGKADCLVLDFGQNILRHGPVDLLTAKQVKKSSSQSGREAVAKVCPTCQTVNAAAVRNCVDCGYAFPFDDRQPTSHDANADDTDPVSDPNKLGTHEVERVSYNVHTKKDADESTPKTMRVNYHIDMTHIISEWVCVEHEGFALRKAAKWWSARCRFPMPDTALEAVMFARHGLIANTISIKTKKNGKFYEVVEAELEEKPYKCDPCPECERENMRVIVRRGDESEQIVCGWCGHAFGYATDEEIQHYGIYDGEGSRVGLIPGELFENQQQEYATPDTPF